MSRTSDDVLELRAAAGWVSPIRPVEPGSLWCVFDQRGTWEWMVHPDDAAHYLANGIVINGERFTVEVVGEWPLLNAIQLRATDRSRNVGFIEAAAA